MSTSSPRSLPDRLIPVVGAALVFTCGLVGWLSRDDATGRSAPASGPEGDRWERAKEAVAPPTRREALVAHRKDPDPRPDEPSLEEILELPLRQRLEKGAEHLLTAGPEASGDRAAARAFAERLFYGLDSGESGGSWNPRSQRQETVLGDAEFAALVRAFGAWMEVDCEGSIAWLATRPIPLSHSILEQISLEAAATGAVDMAGWLESFPGPIDLRTRAVWSYGGALLSTLGPEAAIARLEGLSFLSPDYAVQLVTTVSDSAPE